MLFFDPIYIFLEDGVKSSEIRRCKLLRTYQKIQRPSVNQFDGVILTYGFDYKSKSGDDMTKL